MSIICLDIDEPFTSSTIKKMRDHDSHNSENRMKSRDFCRQTDVKNRTDS